MKVAHVIAGGRHGGAEAFFVRLVKALAAAGLDQRLVIRADRDRAADLAAAGLAPVELPFRPLFDLTSRLGIRRAVRGFAPDLVLTWMSRATQYTPTGRYCLAARLGGYYNPRYYRKCDHLIANTQALRQWLIGHGFASERVHYLPNFVDVAAAAPVARAALDTPADAPVMLGLGRLHDEKGFDLALAAMAEVPGLVFWLAGEGAERGRLETDAARLGVADRVRFLGWRGDAPALLAAADLLVCPSRLEPLGNVVIEAWAHGCPVVAAASHGPRELIADGVDGVLVPLEDAAALAQALRRIAEDGTLRRRLAAAGRVRAAAFGEADVVRQYLECFDRMVTACAA